MITYFLIKITPPWGLALLFTTFAFFTPLIYIKNQALIDGHLSNAQDLISKQTAQARELASQHSSKAMESSKSAFGDYAAKASEMMGGAKKAAVEKGYVSQETADKVPGGAAAAPASAVKTEDFPAAPSTEPAPAATHDGAIDVKSEEEEPVPA